MFCVMKRGSCVAKLNKVVFVTKIQDTFVVSPTGDHLVLNGEIYAVNGRTDLDDFDRVDIIEVNGDANDERLLVAETAQADTDALTLEQEYRITMMELGVNV